MSPKRAPSELPPEGWDTPTGPASTAVGAHKHTRGHTPTIARARTPPPPPPGPEKETFQVVRAPPAPIAPLRRPALTFLSGFSVHAALGWVRGVLAGGRGALGERAAYLPGLTLGLTARGWKAPRGLTSDPLSSPRRSLRPPPPALREKTKFVRSAACYAHPPRGGPTAARGFRPAHRARRGRGREGTFFLRPPPPAGMPHGL